MPPRMPPPVPTYYPRMKRLNAKGPPVLGHLPRIPGLPPRMFREALASRAGILVDTRSPHAFAGGSIQGAINIGATPMLSIWAGWLLDPAEPILLVVDDETEIDKVLSLFVRTGYTRFAGYLAGGMKAWDNAGLPLEELGVLSVHQVRRDGRRLQVVDVRAPSEWAEGHIPGARHRFLPELLSGRPRLARHRPVAVYCDSGYRASIGASLLRKAGFRDVRHVPGSWQAWKHAGFPIERESRDEN